MKSFLVPIEDHSAVQSVLETAAQSAELFGATLTAIPLRAMQFQVVGAEPIVAVSFPPADQDDKATALKAREIYNAFASARSGAEIQINWHKDATIDDIGLGTLARVHDLTVIGRPSSADGGARMTTLESVLFDGGRPVLIAPPKAKDSLGRTIVISWNCSIEAARTVAFAMPMLKSADKVTVLTIEEAVAPGPPGADLCANLKANGIDASEVTTSAGSRKPGAAILEEAANLGADVLIKGAYTQSRLRQMIFGGPTSHILAKAEIPVFMAN